MRLEDAKRLRHGDILMVTEVIHEHGAMSDYPIERKAKCVFFKVIGQHVVVIAHNNLYLALTPEELEHA